jgi:hypothetical protein
MANSQSRVASILENSREELLDLGLRNPLLNYRSSRARGVEVVDELPVEVFRILVREGRPMSFKAAPEGSEAEPEEAGLLMQPGDEDSNGGPAARHTDHRLQTNLTSAKLQSRLIKTERDARTFIEEQGVNILYLVLGTLRWFEAESSQELRKAPLVLVPVALERSNARESRCLFDDSDKCSLVCVLLYRQGNGNCVDGYDAGLTRPCGCGISFASASPAPATRC